MSGFIFSHIHRADVLSDDSEIMLCDFSNGVHPVSFLNLVAADQEIRRPVSRHLSPNSPATLDSEFEVDSAPHYDRHDGFQSSREFPLRIPPLFRLLEAGSWHNHFPGDPRIQLDYSHIISFYDSKLFPSLHHARLGQGRLEHRLEKISPEDARVFGAQLDRVLSDWKGIPSGSGVDWKALFRVITDRYAERLELLHQILDRPFVSHDRNSNATLKEAYRYTTSMIAPYILQSAVPPVGGDKKHTWASSIYQNCATSHTDYIEHSPLSLNLTHSERVLLGGVKGVNKEICRVLVGLWAEGTEIGLAEPDLTMLVDSGEISPEDLVRDWKTRIENLMAWLDWTSHWLKCRPACSYEVCSNIPSSSAFDLRLATRKCVICPPGHGSQTPNQDPFSWTTGYGDLDMQLERPLAL